MKFLYTGILPTYKPITKSPRWTNADEILNITDLWNERFDPENEQGALVYGYYLRDLHDPIYRLQGISVTSSQQIYYPSDLLPSLFSKEELERVDELDEEKIAGWV